MVLVQDPRFSSLSFLGPHLGTSYCFIIQHFQLSANYPSSPLQLSLSLNALIAAPIHLCSSSSLLIP